MARGKPIPAALPPVAAMFMSELKNGILTAGHDLDAVRPSLKCLALAGGESYTALGGRAAATVAGDWMIADREGTLSSILRGPDQRTAITGRTRCVLYTAYAPEGVPDSMLEGHLKDIEGHLRLACESSAPGLRRIEQANPRGSPLSAVGE